MQAQGIGPGVALSTYRQAVCAAMRELLPAALWAGFRVRGDARWTPPRIAWLAVLLFWQEGVSLAERFTAARRQLAALVGHQLQPGSSYQGFVAAWEKWSLRMLVVLGPHLRGLVQAAALAGGCWEVAGWAVIGADGTRVDAPRTAANERALGCGGRAKTTPQIWLTTLMHLATGLPWCWRLGQADADERGHLRRMLALLPARTLLVADAGYTGYDLWQALLGAGHSFLIRVGANVRLLTKLGYAVRQYEGIVYLWPQDQRRAGAKPLILRLIRLHDGRQPMYLVTNVLDHQRLSDAQAARFYRWRWGLELWYRTMKQTLQQRKLRSDTPRHAAMELRWAVVSLTCLGLLQVRTLLEAGLDPHQASTAAVLHAVRVVLDQPQRRWCRGDGLSRRLRRAVKDGYVRHAAKAARAWPHPKKQRPPGCPKLRVATALEVQVAQQLRCLDPAA